MKYVLEFEVNLKEVFPNTILFLIGGSRFPVDCRKESNMNGELLFCKPWKHVTKMIHNQNFDVCVSDIIFGNQQETIAQYHAVIIIDNKIAQLCDFSDKMT